MTVNIRQLLDPDTIFTHFAELTWVAYGQPMKNIGCVIAYERLPADMQRIVKMHREIAVFAYWFKNTLPSTPRMELAWMPFKELYVTDPPHYAHRVEDYIRSRQPVDNTCLL